MVRSVAWSPDCARLATGSEDGTAKIWDAASGACVDTLRGYSGSSDEAHLAAFLRQRAPEIFSAKAIAERFLRNAVQRTTAGDSVVDLAALQSLIEDAIVAEAAPSLIQSAIVKALAVHVGPPVRSARQLCASLPRARSSPAIAQVPADAMARAERIEALLPFLEEHGLQRLSDDRMDALLTACLQEEQYSDLGSLARSVHRRGSSRTLRQDLGLEDEIATTLSASLHRLALREWLEEAFARLSDSRPFFVRKGAVRDGIPGYIDKCLQAFEREDLMTISEICRCDDDFFLRAVGNPQKLEAIAREALKELKVSHERTVSLPADSAQHSSTSPAAPPAQGSLLDVPQSERIRPRCIALQEPPLGRGAYGIVYKATYQRHDRAQRKTVAVKAFHLGRDMGIARLLESARSEIDVLRRLRHPNIIQMYGCVVEPQCTDANGHVLGAALVMEYASEGTLRDLIARNAESGQAWSWSERLVLMSQISSALSYLHGLPRPVLHRDLKSLNVLLSRDRDDLLMAKLCDFGFSKIKLETQTRGMSTRSGRGGTERWAAPETFKDDYESFREPADVYSLGMVLYEIVALRVPYAGWSDMQVIMAKAQGQIPDVRGNADEGAPPQLVQLIIACLSAERSERPRAREVCAALHSEWRVQNSENRQRKRSGSSHDRIMRVLVSINRKVDSLASIRDDWAFFQEAIQGWSSTSEGVAKQVEALSAACDDLRAAARADRDQASEDLSAMQEALSVLVQETRCDTMETLTAVREGLVGGAAGDGAFRREMLEKMERMLSLERSLVDGMDEQRQSAEQQARLLTQLATGETDVPCAAILVPLDVQVAIMQRFGVPTESGMQEAWRGRPDFLRTRKKLYLYFVCPLTRRVARTNGGRGYKLTVPQDVPQWFARSRRFAIVAGTVACVSVVAFASCGIVAAGVPLVRAATDAVASASHVDVTALSGSVAQILAVRGLVREVTASPSPPPAARGLGESKGTELGEIQLEEEHVAMLVASGEGFVRLRQIVDYVLQAEKLEAGEGAAQLLDTGMRRVVAEDGTMLWVEDDDEAARDFRARGAAAVPPLVWASLRDGSGASGGGIGARAGEGGSGPRGGQGASRGSHPVVV